MLEVDRDEIENKGRRDGRSSLEEICSQSSACQREHFPRSCGSNAVLTCS